MKIENLQSTTGTYKIEAFMNLWLFILGHLLKKLLLWKNINSTQCLDYIILVKVGPVK